MVWKKAWALMIYGRENGWSFKSLSVRGNDTISSSPLPLARPTHHPSPPPPSNFVERGS